MNIFSNDTFFINGLISIYEHMSSDNINFFDVGGNNIFMLDLSLVKSYHCYDDLQIFCFCRKLNFSKKDSILEFHRKFLRYQLYSPSFVKGNLLTSLEVSVLKKIMSGHKQRVSSEILGINEKKFSRVKIKAMDKMGFQSFSELSFCYYSWEKLWAQFKLYQMEKIEMIK